LAYTGNCRLFLGIWNRKSSFWWFKNKKFRSIAENGRFLCGSGIGAILFQPYSVFSMAPAPTFFNQILYNAS
jgi:hypothetical protein